LGSASTDARGRSLEPLLALTSADPRERPADVTPGPRFYPKKQAQTQPPLVAPDPPAQPGTSSSAIAGFASALPWCRGPLGIRKYEAPADQPERTNTP